jgi:hypothetical protein
MHPENGDEVIGYALNISNKRRTAINWTGPANPQFLFSPKVSEGLAKVYSVQISAFFPSRSADGNVRRFRELEPHRT